LREVRRLFAPLPRTFARAVWRPGEVCQFGVWQPRAKGPVGHGQTRRGYVAVACLGYSRVGAGASVFSSRVEDLLAGIAGCLERRGGLPGVLLLRVDTNDYSLDPGPIGRRVEVIVDQHQATAVPLDTGEPACRHGRVFARHRTITALEHARALKRGRGVSAETPVEVRPLARYDALIA
jgi:hypothetical protein